MSPWPEASGQSRNPVHGQLAAGRSFTNPVAPEEADDLFHLQASAAKDRVAAGLGQSRGKQHQNSRRGKRSQPQKRALCEIFDF